LSDWRGFLHVTDGLFVMLLGEELLISESFSPLLVG